MDVFIAHCRIQCTAKEIRYGIQGYVWPSSDAYSLFGVFMASGNNELLSTESQTCWRVHRASMPMHLLHTVWMQMASIITELMFFRVGN